MDGFVADQAFVADFDPRKASKNTKGYTASSCRHRWKIERVRRLKVVQIGGDSYRLRDKTKGGVVPKAKTEPV